MAPLFVHRNLWRCNEGVDKWKDCIIGTSCSQTSVDLSEDCTVSEFSCIWSSDYASLHVFIVVVVQVMNVLVDPYIVYNEIKILLESYNNFMLNVCKLAGLA